MTDSVLSIQSAVAYGHVGNAAAVLPLQRLGFEVWPVNTVLFSNHTGYGAWRGRPVDVAWVQEVIDGVAERDAFAGCRAVLSGYLGTPELGLVVLDAVSRVKVARPGAVWLCDPVMGDVGRGFFVRLGIPEFFRDQAMAAADIVTPNVFELGWLTGTTIDSVASALAAAAALRARGPSVVVATSLLVPGRPAELGVLCDTAAGAWVVWTPRLDVTLNGTGDAFAALYLGAWLQLADPAAALRHATGAMFALVAATQAAGARELVMVAAQEVFARPPETFGVERLR